MKYNLRTFKLMLSLIKEDMILMLILVAPILAGLAIRFVVPVAASFVLVIKDYYLVFDIFYSALAPMLFAYVATMVVLEERDNKITPYYAITPQGTKGYIVSRFIIPAVLAFIITLVLLPLFSLTGVCGLQLIFMAFTGTCEGLIIALLMVAFSTNKLEAMAISKLASIVIMAAAVPFFIKSSIQYVLFPLPSLWISKFLLEEKFYFAVIAIALHVIWIYSLIRYIENKSLASR